MAYQEMANLYDFLMKDAPYDDWVTFTEVILKQEPKRGYVKVLDLGCGTGQITCRLASQGYDMTGVDISESMLAQASERAIKEQLKINWFKQDILHLEGLDDYDCVISYCDVINYIIERDQLERAFFGIYQALKVGGVFIFDVHSMAHVQNHMIDQVFSEVYNDLAYIWFCRQGKREGEMHHELTFFVEKQGLYQRFDEEHHQRTFLADDFISLLNDAGFKDIQVFADFEQQPLDIQSSDKTGDRLFFVCKK
ncbi:class I SAM-dependent DNA methyltransferase [Amphibacillus cookii]|uniref:class I SAM-dependent DNA methyltransferase n=1 Tax=Amphibacillus cookii TaxID=767787 RepID=UPI0019560CE0|nr:class I SAM-dependent methyltransferase [Amphibacillus cookii]MBM7541696.1 SAM-dependent methyltransferase [Amphibacillus cookii]